MKHASSGAELSCAMIPVKSAQSCPPGPCAAYSSPLNPCSRLGIPKAKRFNSFAPFFPALHSKIVRVNEPPFLPPLSRQLLQLPPSDSGVPYLGCGTPIGGPVLLFNQFCIDTKSPFHSFISYGESVNRMDTVNSSRRLRTALLPSDTDTRSMTFHGIDNCHHDAASRASSSLSTFSEFDSGVGGSRPGSATPDKTEELVRVTPLRDERDRFQVDAHDSSADTSLALSMDLNSSLVSGDSSQMYIVLDESSVDASSPAKDAFGAAQEIWQPWSRVGHHKRSLSEPEASMQKMIRLDHNDRPLV
jgi:hypothetical protein